MCTFDIKHVFSIAGCLGTCNNSPITLLIFKYSKILCAASRIDLNQSSVKIRWKFTLYIGPRTSVHRNDSFGSEIASVNGYTEPFSYKKKNRKLVEKSRLLEWKMNCNTKMKNAHSSFFLYYWQGYAENSVTSLAIYWTLGNFYKPVATISLPKSPTF